MADEWVKNARGETRVALDAQAEVEMELGALKEKHAKMAEQLKEAVRVRDSAEVGLKMTERQFEEMHKELHYSEINLATEKQMVTELREELRKPRKLPNYTKRQLKPRNKPHTRWGYRRLKAGSQRSSLL